MGALPRRRLDSQPVVARQKGLQLKHVARKFIGIAVEIAAQRLRGPLVRPRRTPKTKINASRKQRLQRAELLGDHHRRVVRQHDPPGADPDRLGTMANMRQRYRGRGTGNALHAMMFSHPETLVAKRLAMPRQRQRPVERTADIAPLRHRREIEYREFHCFGPHLNHCPFLCPSCPATLIA